MKESVVGTENRSEFSRRLMRWCIGGGFVEAAIVFLILVLMLYDPYPWALSDDISPKTSSFIFYGAVLCAMYTLYMVVVSVTLGIIACVKHRRNKPGWRHFAIALLNFVIFCVIRLAFYIIIRIPNVEDLCIYVNMYFFVGLYVALFLSFIWYLVWLIKLYRNEPIKYWSWKTFWCSFAGYVLAVVV